MIDLIPFIGVHEWQILSNGSVVPDVNYIVRALFLLLVFSAIVKGLFNIISWFR